jgi:hypothetical protein
MGVDTPVWRARCGLFRCVKKCNVKKNCDASESESVKFNFEYGVIIAILLIVACVELNPGPVTQQDMETMRKQLQGEISTIRHQVAQQDRQNKKVIEEMKTKIQILTSENTKLKIKVNVLDRQLRKNNVMVFGVPEDSNNESCQETMQYICQNLNVTLEEDHIQDAFRVGRNKGRRPILCKLNSFNKKREILQQSKRCTNIKILNDLSKQDREDLKILKPYAENARKNGQRAIIRGDKLIIEGHAMKKTDLIDNSPQEIFGNRASASPRPTTTNASDAVASNPTPPATTLPPIRDITQINTLPPRRQNPPRYARCVASLSNSPTSPTQSRCQVTPCTSAEYTPPLPQEENDFDMPSLFDSESDDDTCLDRSPIKITERQLKSTVQISPRGQSTRGSYPRGRSSFRGQFNRN